MLCFTYSILVIKLFYQTQTFRSLRSQLWSIGRLRSTVSPISSIWRPRTRCLQDTKGTYLGGQFFPNCKKMPLHFFPLITKRERKQTIKALSSQVLIFNFQKVQKVKIKENFIFVSVTHFLANKIIESNLSLHAN